MKRILTLFIAIVMCTFSSCGVQETNNTNNITENNSPSITQNTRISLTTANASDYLTFSLKGYGSGDMKYNDDLNDSGFYYSSLTANGNISGISGYKYENVVIEVAMIFEFKPSTFTDRVVRQSITDTVELNIGGNGVVNVTEKAKEDRGYCVAYQLSCLGYEIVSISGYVSE